MPVTPVIKRVPAGHLSLLKHQILRVSAVSVDAGVGAGMGMGAGIGM